MRFKSKDFEKYSEKIHDLARDPEIGAARQRLDLLLLERELLERKESAHLTALATADKGDLAAVQADLSQWRRRRWELSRQAIDEYLYLTRRLSPDVASPRRWASPGALAALLAQTRPDEFSGCAVVERASGLEFLHSWCTDDWNGVTLAGIGFGFGEGITSLRYEVDLYGPIFLTLEATWGFIAPNAELCGFEVSSHMSVDGFVDNKATRSVTIAPSVHVNQFRSTLPLDQVESSADPLLSGIWGSTSAAGQEYGAPGYVDTGYGLHAIPTVQGDFRGAYAYAPHAARASVRGGDRLLVSAHLILVVDDYSYAFLADPRSAATPPYYGGVRFERPTVTFYAAA